MESNDHKSSPTKGDPVARTDTAITAWDRRYRVALCRFLRQGPSASPTAAETLGGQAATLGLETLAVAGIHAEALDAATPRDAAPGGPGAEWIEQANTFFKATIVPIEATHRAARQAGSRIDHLTRTLRQRTAESSVSAEQVAQATAQREGAEASAEARAEKHAELLAEANCVQTRLRHEMRAILSQQAGQQQHIGGELRDEIAQSLLAVDLSLLVLKTSGHNHVRTIEKGIADAQRLLQHLSTHACQSAEQEVDV